MDLTIFGKVVTERNPNSETRVWRVKRYPFSLVLVVGRDDSTYQVASFSGKEIIKEDNVNSTNPQAIVTAIETAVKAAYAESTWFAT